MAIMPLERLKLARDDYDQQEKLYNSLVLGQRFYIGIAVILSGASISPTGDTLFNSRDWSSWLVVATAILFWLCLAGVLYHLLRMVLGEPWAMPRSIDHYFAWKTHRVKQLEGGDYEIGEKTQAEFAEAEMLSYMTTAYADSTNVNREANMSRQRRLQWVGKLLITCVISLGLQGLSNVIFSFEHGTELQSQGTTAAAAAAAG